MNQFDKTKYYLFYAFKASSGLIRVIFLLIMKLERKPIIKDKASIGRRLIGLKEKLKPVDRVSPISKLATIEIMTSSKEAITKETKHWINE